MLKSFAFLPTGVYMGTFFGLTFADYLYGGVSRVLQGLPIRLAIFAVFLTLFWWVRRRARAFR